jgi:hypothetical protein
MEPAPEYARSTLIRDTPLRVKIFDLVFTAMLVLQGWDCRFQEVDNEAPS